MKEQIGLEVRAKKIFSECTPDELATILSNISGDPYLSVDVYCDEDYDCDGYGERNGKYSVVISSGCGGIGTIERCVDHLKKAIEDVTNCLEEEVKNND